MANKLRRNLSETTYHINSSHFSFFVSFVGGRHFSSDKRDKASKLGSLLFDSHVWCAVLSSGAGWFGLKKFVFKV